MPRASRTADDDEYGTAADFDRPFDVERAFRARHNGGTGRGSLNDTRGGFLRLRRRGWDGLRALADAKQLTDHQVLLAVALLTRSGWRPDHMGAVMGTDAELAKALGMHPNRVKAFWLRLESLGLGERLVVGNGERAGWRFGREAWCWLAGEEDHPAPRQVVAALAPPPAVDDWPDPFG